MKKILVLLIGLAFAFAGFAKNESNNDSYNMRRAQEAVENGDIEQAIEFYDKELDDNPKNAYAPLLLGQSVLGRLGSIEIDNPGRKLIITR